MRLPLLLALLLAACAPVPPPSEASLDRGDPWAEVQASGEGTVTVLYVPAEGFAYRDEGGGLTGVTVEIVRAFADWLRAERGVRLDLDFVEEPDWRTFYGRVRQGEGGVLGLGNVTITEARRSEVQFSPPYLTNVAVLITRDDTSELASLGDLADTFAGLTPLAFAGTLHETRLRALRDAHTPEAPLATATSNAEIVERVAAGGHYAYVDAYNYWRAREAGAPLRRHPAGDDPGETFGIILPLGSDWGEPLEAFFAHEGGYLWSPAYRALLVEHLGEGVTRALEASGR
jgi:ABC-type amino acid transport substrate-binding protein